MNEILRRAILSVGLDEVDVAARLEVDPKTVRRWLEGRVPFPRYRWALADLLNLDETALWPELRASRPCPDELIALYPHRSSISRETWRNLFVSAKQEISILDYSSLFLIQDPVIQDIFHEKVQKGIRVRIAIGDPGILKAEDVVLAAESRNALVLYRALGPLLGIEIRLHRIALYNSIYRSDDELLCTQRLYGSSISDSPVMHLRRRNYGDLACSYVDSFEQIWSKAGG